MISIVCHVKVRHPEHWAISLHRELDLPFAPSTGCELSHGDWGMTVDRVWWDDSAKVLHLFAANVFICAEDTDCHVADFLRQQVANGWRVQAGSQVKFDILIAKVPDLETVRLSMKAIDEGETKPIQEIIDGLEYE